jgi:hypothetical protein
MDNLLVIRGHEVTAVLLVVHQACCCCVAVCACRGTNLILSGAYADFSPSWYVDVGQSLQLLIIINAVVTGRPRCAKSGPHVLLVHVHSNAALAP